MSSKYAIITVLVLTAVLLGAFTQSPVEADPTVELESWAMTPDPTIVNEPIEFSVKLADETDVKTVYFNLCSSGTCFAPLTMTRGTDAFYRATSEMVTVLEQHYFTIKVELENGTFVDSDKVYFTPISHDLMVETVGISPGKVRVGDEVDVYAELSDTKNITDVDIYHCVGETCLLPIPMTLLANGTYHARIGPFDTKEEVKYNITATYADGHLAWTVDNKFTPVKKSGGDDDDDGGIIPAMGAVAVLAILAGLAVTRRGQGRS